MPKNVTREQNKIDQTNQRLVLQQILHLKGTDHVVMNTKILVAAG